ncbi:MAG TPA: hypothetical protein VF103_02780, partial [Polyangiaceae bacterium]
AVACSANDTTPTGEDKGQGGTGQGGSSGVSGTGQGGAPVGGAPVGGAPTGGVSGSVTGGTGSGGVSGTGPTGGVAGTAGTPATGGVAGTPATGGTAGAAGGGATLVEPIERSGQYVFEFGDLFFQVDPAGARVTDVHLAGGTNLLTGASINATNYGSTFWTSPQQPWNWPPVPEIDSGPYTPAVASPSVNFVGAPATRIPARVAKMFTADLAKVAMNVTYTTQATATGQSFAPWEITRVFRSGITFWPTGSAPRAGGSFQLPPTTDSAGCTWHTAPTANGSDQKLLANGTGGWLAHADGDIVIVKKFADTNMPAPGEDEIELFVSGTANYIEVEQQGAYQAVANGANMDWTVTWFVKRLPSGVTATAGNQALVTFVQSLVQ